MKNNILLAIFTFCIYCYSFGAQCSDASNLDFDNLYQLAENTKSKDLKQFTRLLDSIKSSDYELTQEQKHKLHFLKAYKLTFEGNYKLAKQEIESILQSNKKNLIAFKSNSLLLNIYALEQNWSLATIKALELISSNKVGFSKKVIDQAHLTIAGFYNQISQYELTLQSLKRLRNSTLTKRNLCLKYQFRLSAQMALENRAPSKEDIKKGLDACTNANELLFKSLILTFKAEYELKNNNIDAAVETIQNNESMIDATGYAIAIVKASNIVADAYLKKEEYKLAQHYVNKALSKIEAVKLTKQATDTFRINYLLAEQRGDLKSALDFHKKYLAAERAYMDETSSCHLAFQMANRRELENKNRIKLLNAENAQLTATKKLADEERQSSHLLVSLLIFIVATLALWLTYASYTNRKFKYLAEIDYLTNIYNRRKFISITRVLLPRAQKEDEPISCVVFDLDQFKKINDNFGHAVGDMVIKKVVEACKQLIPQESIFARVAGEEFVIFMPDTSLEVAEYIARECATAIQRISHQVGDLTVKTTASFGITDTISSGYNIDNILADADSAMYNSKNMGRNSITVFRK